MTTGFDPKTFEALKALYEDLDQEILRMKPACRRDGDCCRFGQSGLQLFVTPLEAAYLIRKTEPSRRNISWETCPFQGERLCTARESRPLGCRIYFCDPKSETALESMRQDFHVKVKKLHDFFEMDYLYEPHHLALSRLGEGGERIASL